MPDTNKPASPDAGTSRPATHHDTVLLTDHSAASSSSANSSPSSSAHSFSTRETPAGHSVLITNISPAALAALGQRYDILAEAGHGSMGNVYKARDRETGEIVALKLLKPEIASDQAMMDRFKNELLFARKITHKNVCRVYDFNRIAGIAYTSMEFVNGESLRSVLNRFGGLPMRKANDIALQICSGLKEAHAQGIVHRDLKPENVMIDSQGNVKIMDFGIARSMDVATRMTGSMVGTPAYMAPEQVSGKPVDYRTDIYSLGLVLYEIYTGVPTFHADTAVAVALKQLNEAPTPPHTLDPSFPAPVERVILRCLEKEPAKRFSSAAELIQALSPFSSSIAVNRPPSASPVPTPHPSPRSSTVPPASTHGSAAPSAHVTNPFYTPSAVPPPARRSGSPFAWILLGGILAVAAFGSQKWVNQAKLAEHIPPPTLPHSLVPAPPAFALNPGGVDDSSTNASAGSGSAPQTDASNSALASSQPSSPQSSTAAPSSTAADSGASPAPAAATVSPDDSKPKPDSVSEKKPTAATPKSTVPASVQQHADNAFKENPDSVAAFHAGTYLWVGRYDKKQRAEAAAKRIEDLGLPALVVPRHGLAEDFFIVLSGPYDAKRIASVSQWLNDQGFQQVREFKWPPAKAGANP
jgi:serine/threonine protein kinase